MLLVLGLVDGPTQWHRRYHLARLWSSGQAPKVKHPDKLTELADYQG